ncbi:hypothetical protein HY212_01955 [Candidatus Pacearchaeota archaeon]|nr:hypothetical protein [Candidatus Pacearchaeota archaeon]
MEKLVLYAIGNSGKFNYFIFKKDKRLLEVLDKIFNKVFERYLQLYGDDIEQLRGRDVFRLKDMHDPININGRGHRIDIFYGDKRVYVSVICEDEDRVFINELLEEYAEMPEPKKLKKIKKKKNGKKRN